MSVQEIAAVRQQYQDALVAFQDALDDLKQIAAECRLIRMRQDCRIASNTQQTAGIQVN